MSSALALVAMSKRWLTTTWNALAGTDLLLGLIDGGEEVALSDSESRLDGILVVRRRGGRRGLGHSAVILQRRHRGAQASSTRSSVLSQFTAVATSRTPPSV